MTDRGPSRRDALRMVALTGVSTALGSALGWGLFRQARLRHVSETRTRMGTVVTLTAVHPSAAEAREIIGAGFAEIDRLEAVMSRHRADTALGRLNEQGRLDTPPEDLVRVLTAALDLAEATEGAFDPTVLPVLQLWERSYETTDRPPGTGELREALARVDFRAVELSEGRVAMRRPGMALTLDGIAKGYIVDRTLDALVRAGAERVLVDAGGDIATGGPGTPVDPWTVAIQDPLDRNAATDVIRLQGDAVATSGDYQGSFTLDRRFHHVLDPRTGRSPEHMNSVSVIAESAMTADGLSTAVMVLGPIEGRALLEGLDGVEGLLVDKRGAEFRTSGFGRSST